MRVNATAPPSWWRLSNAPIDARPENAGTRRLSASDRRVILTEPNFFVESNTAGSLFSHHLLGGEEDALLLLEGPFILKISHLR